MSVRKAATILARLDQHHANRLLAFVDEKDEKLARQLRDEMVLFSDLRQVDARGMQALLREVDPDVLLIALKGAEWPLVEKILDNLSPRAAETLREELAILGPVQAKRVLAARQTILESAIRLQSRGQLWFAGKGNEKEYIF